MKTCFQNGMGIVFQKHFYDKRNLYINVQNCIIKKTEEDLANKWWSKDEKNMKLRINNNHSVKLYHQKKLNLMSYHQAYLELRLLFTH